MRNFKAILILFVCLFYVPAQAQFISPAFWQHYVLSLFAGDYGSSGNLDGTALASRFNNPIATAVDSAGNLFVLDNSNCTIRKMTTAGIVSTFAGSAGSYGSTDGTGSAARFNYPYGMTIDSSDNLYVTDRGNYTIRKITSAAVVTTIAGTVGVSGSTDGTGTAAKFGSMGSLAVDSSANLWVVDSQNGTIRKVTSAGVVTTFAGTAGVSGSTNGTGAAAKFSSPQGIAIDSSGNLYVADYNNYTIRKITTGAVVTTFAGTAGSSGTTNGTGAAARFYFPQGVAVDSSGNLYVSDAGNQTIRMITSAAVVTTFAGTAGTSGAADGTGTAAKFKSPVGISFDSSGNLFVADSNNSVIRKITPSTAIVTTVAGMAAVAGGTNGTGAAATFDNPIGLAADGSGNIYVADVYSEAIRKITPTGVVTTLAGSGTSGSANGTGTAASFSNPYGVVADNLGNVFVADTSNSTIRKITSAGVVTTFAGTAGSSGTTDGTGAAARFSFPTGITIDGSGNLYVADNGNNTIRKITSAGVVTTFAGTAGSSGTTDGTGTAAKFYRPFTMVVDTSGNIFVADYYNYTIRKITPAGVVTTFAGMAGVNVAADGTGTAASFSSPQGLAIDGSNNLYVVESTGNMIRKVTPAAVVTTIVGKSTRVGNLLGPLPASIYQPEGATAFGKHVYIAVPNAILTFNVP